MHTSTRSIGFCIIWVCISSSSSGCGGGVLGWRVSLRVPSAVSSAATAAAAAVPSDGGGGEGDGGSACVQGGCGGGSLK